MEMVFTFGPVLAVAFLANYRKQGGKMYELQAGKVIAAESALQEKEE